jgi:hypothetical protein
LPLNRSGYGVYRFLLFSKLFENQALGGSPKPPSGDAIASPLGLSLAKPTPLAEGVPVYPKTRFASVPSPGASDLVKTIVKNPKPPEWGNLEGCEDLCIHGSPLWEKGTQRARVVWVRSAS